MVSQEEEIQMILKQIEDYYGFVPKIFQELQHNPEAFKAHFYKTLQLQADRALPDLTKELIAIGSAAAGGTEHCLSTHIKVARQMGAPDDQILLAILIGAAVTETAALSKSLRVWRQ